MWRCATACLLILLALRPASAQERLAIPTGGYTREAIVYTSPSAQPRPLLLTSIGRIKPSEYNSKVDDYSIFHLTANYTGFKNLTLTAGIKNILDEDPPFAITYDSNTGAGSSWEPRVADPRGRSFTMMATYKFF